MIVSIVIPTRDCAPWWRRVSATDVKKKEKTPAKPHQHNRGDDEIAQNIATPTALRITPIRMVTMGRSRSVRSPDAVSPTRNARSDTEKRPRCAAISQSRIPAVAIAPADEARIPEDSRPSSCDGIVAG